VAVVDPLGPQGDGETLLGEDDRRGLKLSYVTTRGALNEAEQANILEAEARARNPRRKFAFSEPYLNRLHREMFGNVWKWAGRFRTGDTNLGRPFHLIAPELRVLLDDCKYQLEHNAYELDELAARFKYRLVSIHPYPNGNGRHSRLAAEIFLESVGRPAFTWGRVTDPTSARARYIAALHEADAGNMAPLLAFVRS
jgi:Fic-DOC domain mobile mystery protein B